MNKIELMGDVTAEIRRIDECIKTRRGRVNELVSNMPIHKLFGNQELFKRCGRFVMQHGECLADLENRRERLVTIFRRLAG